MILASFALGVGLFLSTFAVHFPDVREMYQILLQAWMYFTPIIYPETTLPEAYRFWILHLNPMYYMVHLFREPIFNGVLPEPDIIIGGIIIAGITLVAGWVYFAKQSDTFAYKA
jgi:ABC-type polysaccharide/polyol phosphate export permease